MRVSKFLLVKIWILAAFLLAPSMQAAAVEDGAYVGFFQVTYAIPEANRELNDTGELLLVIEDNKIVDIQYDDEGFVKHGYYIARRRGKMMDWEVLSPRIGSSYTKWSEAIELAKPFIAEYLMKRLEETK